MELKQFKIYIDNKTSELARVSDAIGKVGINIKAIVSEGAVMEPFVKLVTNDVATTERALKSQGFSYELKEILDIELHDRPGELSKVAKKLARAGVQVESLYILGQKDGKTEVALVVDDLAAARKALSV